MKSVFGWNAATQQLNTVATSFAFNRFCSADLAPVTGLSFGALGTLTTERLFLHGEEGGATGLQQATAATGAEKGRSYTLGKFNLNTNGSSTSTLSPVQLNVTSASTASNTVTAAGTAPREFALGAQLLGQTVTASSFNAGTGVTTVTLSGNANTNIAASTPTNFTLAGVGAWENTVVNPTAQTQTVAIGNNDGGTGIMNNALSLYVGTKTSTGTAADRAGLTNGTLSFVNVAGLPVERTSTAAGATPNAVAIGTAFTLSTTASTQFSRPEDGAWDTLNANRFYFVTTDRLDQVQDNLGAQVGRSRLWRLNFASIANPNGGGTIDLLIDGQKNGVAINMFDNITVGVDGHVFLQEDVGAADHNGKVWEYNPLTDTITQILKHDPSKFGDVTAAGVITNATAPFNNDEETSGIIDISSIMGTNGITDRWLISSDQAHYTTGVNTATNVEGGQIFAVHIVPEPSTFVSLLGGLGMLLGFRRRRA